MSDPSPAVARPTDRRPSGGLPAGVTGEEAFHHGQGWVGFLRLAPGAVSAWHHHGEYDSYAYVTAGVLRWEHGEDGRDATEVRPGDVGYMPARVVHRDVSAGDEDLVLALFRAGHGALTIEVPGPSAGRATEGEA